MVPICIPFFFALRATFTPSVVSRVQMDKFGQNDIFHPFGLDG